MKLGKKGQIRRVNAARNKARRTKKPVALRPWTFEYEEVGQGKWEGQYVFLPSGGMLITDEWIGFRQVSHFVPAGEKAFIFEE